MYNFIDSYDNNSLSKSDINTENPEYLITYEVEPEDNPNTEGEGQITHYPTWQRKRPNFSVVETFEFGGVDYCCTLWTIPANYSEAINSPDSNNWILTMRREFDSLVDIILLNGRQLQKIKILSVVGGFILQKVKVTEVMSIKLVS